MGKVYVGGSPSLTLSEVGDINEKKNFYVKI